VRRLLLLVVAAVSVALLAGPARTHLRSAGLLVRLAEPTARPLLLPSPAALVEEDLSVPGPGGRPMAARLYRPLGIDRPPGMVVVHGVHRLGIEDPRLAVFARALAGAGIAVLTPQIAPLTEYRVDAAGVDLIGAAAVALASRTDVAAGGVGVMGMSFAGGLALLAAAEPRYAPSIREVVAVGAYDDLERVSRFLATDQALPADGPAVALAAHEYGALVLAHSHPEDFFAEVDRAPAAEGLRLWLREEKEAAVEAVARLTPSGQAEFDHLLHDRPAIRAQLLASIARHAAEMAAVSPRGHLAGLRAPVFLLHGVGDTVIPATEVSWLVKDLPAGTLQGVLVTPLLEHVSLQGAPPLTERWRAIHFLAGVLAAD
jgi:pimeloyl-ACP methyl ester carboxylesterase